MLNVGSIVPEFECLDDTGQTFTSKNYKGQKWIVFFYPKASTPGCTAEACSLRDDIEILKEKGYAVVGVSADSVKKQAKFKDSHKLSYPLLADTEKEVINIFGVWGEKKFMGKTYQGIHRVTFVIDEHAKVSHVIDKVKTKTHASQIIDLIG